MIGSHEAFIAVCAGDHVRTSGGSGSGGSVWRGSRYAHACARGRAARFVCEKSKRVSGPGVSPRSGEEVMRSALFFSWCLCLPWVLSGSACGMLPVDEYLGG